MSLQVKPFVLGRLKNNTYLLFDSAVKEGIVIDPSFEIEHLIDFVVENQVNITGVWLTHAHFDHFAGLVALRNQFPNLKTALHPLDLPLWEKGGLSGLWNFNFEMNFTPEVPLQNGMVMALGSHPLAVLHTPGHSPGHVVFYSDVLNCAFCGDLIFNMGVGRTDLPGGSEMDLLESITTKIFTLPPSTVLHSGHGPRTTVEKERANNPFI